MNRGWNKLDNGQMNWLEFSKLKNIPFVSFGLIVKPPRDLSRGFPNIKGETSPKLSFKPAFVPLCRTSARLTSPFIPAINGGAFWQRRARNSKGKSFAIEVCWKDKFKRFLRKQIGYAGGIVVPRQVHQNDVASITKSEKFNLRKKLQADALLTNQEGLFLTIQVADCIPIYIVDTKKKVVGLVHAGWRGTLMGIAEDAANEAKRNFNCSPKDLRVVFGPAIGKCCYEVNPEVAILFPSRFVNYEGDRRPKLDLVGFNRAQLIESGVKEQNISLAGECTFCGPRFLCSYRRDKNKKERMLAFIGIK